jgi:hypothetical protein
MLGGAHTSGLDKRDPDSWCGGKPAYDSYTIPFPSEGLPLMQLHSRSGSTNRDQQALQKLPGLEIGKISERGNAAEPTFGVSRGETLCVSVYLFEGSSKGKAVLSNRKGAPVRSFDVEYYEHKHKPTDPRRKPYACWSEDSYSHERDCPDEQVTDSIRTAVLADANAQGLVLSPDATERRIAEGWRKVRSGGGPWFSCAQHGCCKISP